MAEEPEVFTVDYEGEPGARTFYLQTRTEMTPQSYLVEKQQIAVLAEKIQEVLLAVDPEDTLRGTTPARDPAMGLIEPIEARWRVGAIGLGFDELNDRVIIVLHESTGEFDEEDDEPEIDPASGDSFSLRRDQARAFVLHAIAVLAEGRPLCRLCGLPMDPGGHACPASNGHRVG